MHLQRAQNDYRELMRTQAEVISLKSGLDWEIRFGPKHNVPEEKIRELVDEHKSVMKKRKKIEKDKGPTQRRLERLRKAITGTATVSSKNDNNAWGIHTPVPTDNEDEDDESEEEKSD